MDLIQLFKRHRRDSSQVPQASGSSGGTSPKTSTLERMQPHSPHFPDGVIDLYPCDGADVDVCFVHGLTGDRVTTWTVDGQDQPWPKTLLPNDLSEARLLSWGYDAYFIRTTTAGTNRLIDHAINLLNDLTTDRKKHNAVSRPIIFVVHSLGGLVCKEAILQSRNNPEVHLRNVFDNLKGIIFMGTPHMGSWMADWAKIPVWALGITKSTNRSLIEVLGTDNQFLESIQTRFLSIIRELREGNRQLRVTCFYEEKPLPVVGKVVSKASATFEAYSTMSIHANHMNMVRFRSTSDNGYKRVLGELERWRSEIKLERQTTGSLEDLETRLSNTSTFDHLSPNVRRFVKMMLFDEGHQSGWRLIDEGDNFNDSQGNKAYGGTFVAYYPQNHRVRLYLTIPSLGAKNRADWKVDAPLSLYYPGRHSGHLIFDAKFPLREPAVYWDTPIFSPFPRCGKFSGDLPDHWVPSPQSLLQVVMTMASLVLIQPNAVSRPCLANNFALYTLPKLGPGQKCISGESLLKIDDEKLRQITQFFSRSFNRTDNSTLNQQPSVHSTEIDHPNTIESITDHHRQISCQAIDCFISVVLTGLCGLEPPFHVDGKSCEQYFSKLKTFNDWFQGELAWALMLDQKSNYMVTQYPPGQLDSRNQWYHM